MCDYDGDGGDDDEDGDDGDGDDDHHRLHSGTMCFPEKIRTSMGIKANNIFGLISQTFQFMAKYIFSAIHLKNNPFCLKIFWQHMINLITEVKASTFRIPNTF